MIVYNNSIIKSTKGEFDIVTFEQLKQRLHLEEAKAGHYYYSTSKNPIIKMVNVVLKIHWKNVMTLDIFGMQMIIIFVKMKKERLLKSEVSY